MTEQKIQLRTDQELPEFRLFYVCRTFHADYLPEFCSTNSEIFPRFLNMIECLQVYHDN